MPEVLYKTIEWQRRITVVEDGTTRVSLTGKTLKLQVRARSSEAVLVELSSGDGITHLSQSGATEGQADAVISTGLQTVLQGETNYVFVLLLDDQVVKAPDFLEVQSLS